MHASLVTLISVLALWSAPSGQQPEALPPTGGQTQAQSVPVLSEPSWTFQDGGNTYFVGKQTGAIVVIRGSDDGLDVRPRPTPAPVPPPVPIVSPKVAWVSLIVDPADPVAASFRTDPDSRNFLAQAGVEFRSYTAAERDLDSLGFSRLVAEKGLPLAIEQDKTGRVLFSQRVEGLAGWRLLCSRVRPLEDQQ